MKRAPFWLMMCLVSAACEALFVWASFTAVARDPEAYGAAGFLIAFLWIAAALGLVVLDLCALIDIRLIPKDAKVELLAVFRSRTLTRWRTVGRAVLLAAVMFLMWSAFSLFSAAGARAVLCALAVGLYLLLLFSWWSAAGEGARAGRAEGRTRRHWGVWLLVAAVVLPLLGLVRGVTAGYGDILRSNWDVALPGGYRQVYEAEGEPDPGDGLRYHVLFYPSGVDLEDLVDWSEEGDVSGAARVLDDLNVPGSERPDTERCLFWYARRENDSRIWLFWDREATSVYIVESLWVR